MLECSDLRLSLNHKCILRGVNWQAQAGEVTAIIGPNGAGKSSLLKVFLGLLKPTSGQVRIHGKCLSAWSSEILATKRAYMAQSSFPKFSLPVYEYLCLARLQISESQNQCDANVESIIKHLEIIHLAQKNIDELSGGEFQRIELARVWCQMLDANGVEGKLLMLDEPSSALDIHQSSRLYTLLRDFTAQGGTVVLVEHDINLAARFCDSLLLLKNGQTVAQGRVRDIFQQGNVNQCFDVAGTLVRNEAADRAFFSV